MQVDNLFWVTLKNDAFKELLKSIFPHNDTKCLFLPLATIFSLFFIKVPYPHHYCFLCHQHIFSKRAPSFRLYRANPAVCVENMKGICVEQSFQ